MITIWKSAVTARLNVSLPGIGRKPAQALVDAAHDMHVFAGHARRRHDHGGLSPTETARYRAMEERP